MIYFRPTVDAETLSHHLSIAQDADQTWLAQTAVLTRHRFATAVKNQLAGLISSRPTNPPNAAAIGFGAAANRGTGAQSP